MRSTAICVISRSTCPYFNLSFENFLFNERRDADVILFLWQNSPCVVIGRNQIPWLECDVQHCQQLGIPIIRRFSGGGAVYHDLGNSLFSFITPRSLFSRSRMGELISGHFSTKLSIPLQCNTRHDLVLDGRKVSGSAFRIVRDRAYHHGTMLHGSDLDRIGRILDSPMKGKIVGATVTSVVSPVTNVPGLDHPRFVQAMTEILDNNFKVESIETVDQQDQNTSLLDSMALLRTWDWTFGKGPQFQFSEQIKL